MPEEQYEGLQDTVLSWKKRQQLGRFDPNKPNKPDVIQQKQRKMQEEIDARGIAIGKRCRVGGAELDRRGTVRYVGPVQQIPGEGLWIGMRTLYFLTPQIILYYVDHTPCHSQAPFLSSQVAPSLASPSCGLPMDEDLLFG